MRVLVIGASGAIGTRLVPQLIERGHEVIGTSRSPRNGEHIRTLGAKAIVLDLRDLGAVRETVLRTAPDAIVNEATALADVEFSKDLDSSFVQTNRLRTEGTDAVLAAARDAGVSRIVAQSFASLRYIREGGPVKTEEDPLDPDPPVACSRTLEGIRYLEATVPTAEGIDGLVLRYGSFYGPGTSVSLGGAHVELIRKRRFPIIGSGAGVWSWIHMDDVAGATVAAVERGAPGVYNVVDDEPAPVSEWLPYLAQLVGGKPPLRVPRWVGRLAGGSFAVSMMDQIRGSSNARAKRELGWQPTYPSWRQGFEAVTGAG
jgi:2-alkyl-3-oxoalkanoate reductase